VDDPRPGRLRPAALAVLAAAAAALGAAGVLPRWQGLVHVVALPPLDLVHDLGALLVHAPGWPTYLLAAAGAVAVRAAVLALVLGGLDRRRVGLALRFYTAVAPLAFLAAALLYGAKAVLFYGLFWLGLLLSLALVLATGAVPWVAADRLRTGLADAARHGFRAGTIACYLGLLTLLGWAADAGGALAQVGLVPVSAALTYATAQALHRDPGWRAVRRVAGAVPAAGVVALLVVAATGPSAPPRAEPPSVSRAGSIMLMSGIDSSSGSGAILEIDPAYMGWTCERTLYYSYAGPGDGQPRQDALCPIEHGAPYEPEDTVRSRDELVPFLEAQAGELVPPGVVAGHSQGVWLLWQAASEDRLPMVGTIVLVGAFPENPVSYPAAGERAPGGAGRTLLDAIADLPRPGGTTVFDPDSPLGREWLGHPDAVEQTLARPLPDGIRALSVASAFDLPLVHGTHRIEGAVDACPVPVVHPDLPYAAELQDAIVAFVEERPLPPCAWWRTQVGALVRHFTVPPSRR
jgi:hypothetical protein